MKQFKKKNKKNKFNQNVKMKMNLKMSTLKKIILKISSNLQ